MGRGIRFNKLKKIYNDNLVLDLKDHFLPAGKVYGIVGTNGVGKTTLMKMIVGSEKADEGTIATEDMSVEMVYHDNGLFHDLSVCENMFMGQEPEKNFLGVLKGIDWKTMKSRCQSILDDYGLGIKSEQKVSELKFSTQKLLEIIIAMNKDPDILIIDEPLVFLDMNQVDYMQDLFARFMKEDRMILCSSHRLDEIIHMIDTVVTMRDKTIASIDVATESLLAGMLEFSETVVHKYPKRNVPKGGPILEVAGLRTKDVRDINFKVMEGEILGIVGLRGASKSDIGKALFGAIPSEGKVRVMGSEKRVKSTSHAVEAGICYLGDAGEGVFLDDSIIDNIVSANIPRARKLSRSAKRLVSKYYLDVLNIRYDNENQSLKTISMGNKQKVLLAKWFFSKSKVFIFNKPTANIDSMSKVDIYNIFVDLAESGAGLLLISNDLEEVAGMCDRVLVIDSGRLKSEIDRKDLSVHRLVEAMQNW